MKDKIELKNGTEIELESGSSIGNLTVLFEDKSSMVNTWELFTSENLSEVKIKTSDGRVVGNYSNLLLVSETSTILSNGIISTSFILREKTNIELQIESLMASQEIQDGAISELGDVISSLSNA